VKLTVAYDAERDAWAVIVDNTEAVTFSGDHAREHAETVAERLQSLADNELPWFMHDNEDGNHLK
jgi:hypothetical protein